MNKLPMTEMIEATRLTREGRLGEAMTVIRGALCGAPSYPSGSSVEADAPQPPTARTPTTLDMVPPSIGTGGS